MSSVVLALFRRPGGGAARAAQAASSLPAAPPAPLIAPAMLAEVALQASHLGREAAEVRGVLDDTQRVAGAQAQAARALAAQLQEVQRVQGLIGEHTRSGTEAVGHVRQAVEGVGAEVSAIVDTLRQVSEAAAQITKIALQTRLVAFNASVEAKRAGEAGRGFGVVADAVKDLAEHVERSSKDITGTVGRLDARIGALAAEIQARADGAPQGAVHAALGEVDDGVARIASAALQSHDICDALDQRMGEIESQMHATQGALASALGRSDALLVVSERLIETVADSGLETQDTPYIRAVQQAAAEIAGLLAEALRAGQTSAADLFDEAYKPVPGTRPQQHTTRFCALADRLFPQVQERLLGFSDKVVFCIAVDRNGYVATHNKIYCQPQRGDLAWDTAHSRWRRIFNDRTGLASARNRRPFLLQTYRRDMGAGQFVVMKEAAAPIELDGRHWGGLRLAFRF